MNAQRLSPKDQVTLADGSLAEVLSVATDFRSVHVKYVDTLDNPEIAVGTEADVPPEEVIALFMGTHAEGDT